MTLKCLFVVALALLVSCIHGQQIEYVTAWSAPNGSLWNAPRFHPPSGGVACFALNGIDPATQNPICIFYRPESNEEFARSESAIFGFLDFTSRYPEILPQIGNTNDTRFQNAINVTSTLATLF